jgi:Zn-dependent protease
VITSKEMLELLKAWVATSIAFGVLIYYDTGSYLFSVLVAAFTVGLGFIFHELAHRYVAFKFRKHAEFRANNTMLILSILMSFLGFIIAAPGAVMIGGFVTRKESGMIAAAGPAANLALAVLFIPLLWVIPEVAQYGFMINALLGLFNLVPIPGFDGEKVIGWSKPWYFTIGAIAVVLNIANIILPNLIHAG